MFRQLLHSSIKRVNYIKKGKKPFTCVINVRVTNNLT